MRRALLITALVVSGVLLIVANALAKGGGGGHGAGMSGHAGGKSGSHMSDKGLLNTNAQFLPDSTRGLERAQERMSEEGLTHQRAGNGDLRKAKKPVTPKP